MTPNVWILGGEGMLGQAVCAELQAAGIKHVATSLEVDITKPAALSDFARKQGAVSHMINCAAYTRVDDCETHEAEATTVNGDGPGHIATVAAQIGAIPLHVSTDYVFNGEGTVPYVENAPCAPLGAYGRSKLRGEETFLAALGGKRGYIVRTSWLFGHGGPNFVRTMLRLMGERESLGVVADQFGRPTLCDDLARALLGLGGLLQPQAQAAAGVYHFANSGHISWHGFASAILAGAQARGMPVVCKTVRPLGTADYPLPARRPAYSVLSTDKIAAALQQAPRPWTAALDSYLDKLAPSGPTVARTSAE